VPASGNGDRHDRARPRRRRRPGGRSHTQPPCPAVTEGEAEARADAPAGAAREIRRLYRRIAMAPDLRPGPHIDPLLHRLVHFVVSIPPDHAPAILADPAVRALRPHLVALCARAEQELEAAWSAWVSASRVPPLTLLRFPYLDNYRQLTELEHTALARHIAHPPRRVLFVGSGPLPLSSLHLAGVLGTGTTIDNLDRDPAAIAGARRLTHRLDARRLAFHHGDLADLHDLRPYDLVVLAALVGLTAADKRRHLHRLRQAMAPGAVLLARSAHGLRTLLYPAVHLEELDGFELLHVTHPTGPVLNSTVLARKPRSR